MLRCESACAPILLMGFNRPDFVRQQIHNIAPNKPSKVYFAVDGARNEHERILVEKTRAAIKAIDWQCDVRTLFREENRSCRYAPPEAISWFFDHEECGIVLEDDCWPAPEFLSFATELLDKYRDEQRIGAITAFNRHNLQSDKKYSYHFSKEFNVWAWASWKRVWKDYDVTMKRYATDLDDIIEHHTTNGRMRKYWRDSFRATMDGSLNTWDYQVACMFMAHGYLSVIPRERLVANMGILSSAGSHTNAYDFFAEEFAKAGHVHFPLIHPHEIKADKCVDDRVERIIVGRVPRLINAVGCVCPRLLRPLITFMGRAIRLIAPWLFEL